MSKLISVKKMNLKSVLKFMIPLFVLRFIQKYRMKRVEVEYEKLTTQQVFSKIYEEGAWGGDPENKYFSGNGSRDEKIVRVYIDAVERFLSSFDRLPDVVDLGCGDFYVGSRVRHRCGGYIACDIVPALIEFNREKFKSKEVEFLVLDLTKDELPKADIVFIRQVLQHLSNDRISKALSEIASKYKYLVLTEHLPNETDFTPNLDKPAGPGIRLGIGSGVVLTSPPFDFNVKSERLLCEVSDSTGLIRTTLYEIS